MIPVPARFVVACVLLLAGSWAAGRVPFVAVSGVLGVVWLLWALVGAVPARGDR